MRSLTRALLALSLLLGCGDDDGSPDAGPADATLDGTLDAAADAVPDAGPTPLAWELVDAPAEGPLLLWGALVVDVGPTSAVVFGGTSANDSGGTTEDSAWRYDWVDDALVATSIGSRPGPAARYCGCAAYDAARDVVIVAGGRDLTGPFLATPETWELDLATDTWTQWTGETPLATLGCMMTTDAEGELYWFGGISSDGPGPRNTLYRAEGQSWVEVSVSGDLPAPRYDGVLWSDSDGLLLFGGSENAFSAAFYADVWRFADGAWTLLDDGSGVAGRRVPWFRPTDDGFIFAGGFDMNMNPMDGLFRWTAADGFVAIDVPEHVERLGFAAALPAPSGVGVLFSGYDGDGPVPLIRWLR